MKDFSSEIIARYQEFKNHDMKAEEALYLIRLMFELNFHGFERYISAYFHKIQGYTTKVIGGLNDHGIDIEGSKLVGHKELNLAIQCKKWFHPHEAIKKDKILAFDDDAKHRKNYNHNPILYFITTTNASKKAKETAQKNGIKIADCRDLLRMKPYYGLDNFKKDANKRNNNGDRLFTKNNVTKTIQDSIIEHKIFHPVPH